MKILFQPRQRACEALPGETLLQAAARAKVLIDGSCAGAGTCGKCKVRIISGACSPLTQAEACLDEAQLRLGYRLACQAKPLEDVVVELPGTHLGSGRKKRMAHLPEGFAFEPAVEKRLLRIKRASMQDQRSDLDRLLDTLDMEGAYMDYRMLGSLHGLLKGEVTLSLDGKRIFALEKGNTVQSCYGLAVDIGTTTVVAMLWDLARGEQVDVASRTNPQSLYGADVISRIQYCNEAEGNLERMHRKIMDCINDMIAEMCRNAHIDAGQIADVAVVGNTTMSHLFLNIHPQPLARTPFAPVFCAAQQRVAMELGLHTAPLAAVRTLPNIAGHVGADISSVMLAVSLSSMRGLHAAIDIGTNGEILLAKDGRILTCSTAAGPAFEGAQILMGMRAADGAIERVRYENGDIHIETIENRPPIGICGSGLIDAVAALLEAGVVDGAGRMRSAQEGVEAGLPPSICARMQEHEGKPAFVLAYMEDGKPVLLTQNDVREVQLAKGAIYAGLETMLGMLGESAAALESIILAGAFGNYINKRSALIIGLLPTLEESRIVSVGNAAGAGACMALLNGSCRERIGREVRQVEHVELSNSMEFQDAYIRAMAFPNRESHSRGNG